MKDWRFRYKIKCAATRHGDHITAGAYHGECLKIAGEAGLEKCGEFGQGFLTENMRFVRRKEALAIAQHYDQIKHKHNCLSGCLVIWTDDVLIVTAFKTVDANDLNVFADPNQTRIGSGTTKTKNDKIKAKAIIGTVPVSLESE